MAHSDNIRIRELKEANELLLLQLHQVQDALEACYLDRNDSSVVAAASHAAGAGTFSSTDAGAGGSAALVARVRKARGDSPGTKDIGEIVREAPEYRRLKVNLDHANERIRTCQGDLQRLQSEKEDLEITRRTLAEQVESGNAMLEEVRSAQSRDRLVLEQRHAEETAALKARIGQLERDNGELTERCQALEQDHAEDTAALKARIGRLERDNDELGGQMKSASKALDRAKSQWHNERQVLVAEKHKEIEDLQARIGALEEALNSKDQACRELTQRTETLQKNLEEKDRTIESARSDVAVSVRLQTLRENDLQDLQSRYGDLLNKKEEQDKLLTKLYDRLSVAAECLKQLEFEKEANLDADSARKLARSLSGDPDTEL